MPHCLLVTQAEPPPPLVVVGPNHAFVPTLFGYAFQGGAGHRPSWSSSSTQQLVPSLDPWPSTLAHALALKLGAFLLSQRSLLHYQLEHWAHWWPDEAEGVEQSPPPGVQVRELATSVATTTTPKAQLQHERLKERYFRYTRLSGDRSISFKITYLPTIRLQLSNPRVNPGDGGRGTMMVRALLDTASDYSMLSRRMVRQLGLLPKLTEPKMTMDMMGTPLYLHAAVWVRVEPVELSSLRTRSRSTLSTKQLAAATPTKPPQLSELVQLYVQPMVEVERVWRSGMGSIVSAIVKQHPQLELADDDTELAEVDALLGQDLLTALVQLPDNRHLAVDDHPGLALAETRFGWTVSGVQMQKLI